MLALINNMQYSFDWNGVEIVRLKTENEDCFYFIDRYGNRVQQCCLYNTNQRVALQSIKLKITRYIHFRWVVPSSYS